MTHPLRRLPAVQWFLEHERVRPWVSLLGRTWVVRQVRELLDEVRAQAGTSGTVPDREALVARLVARLLEKALPRPRAVINATGVVLHTNLGRAPLSAEALAHLLHVASGYSDLEFDLPRGRRGKRLSHVVPLLRQVTGAEDALVVNNNAAATLLVLQALARRRRVVVARTQLVEIGGSFRIPEILQQSGARLVEVGATNRVHLEDYRQVLESQPVALVLWVHRSNFRIVGFHSEPSLAELARLAHAFQVPLVADVGSGALLDTRTVGLPYEPTVQDCLRDGADLVTFSGDKLLGGPQAGIVVGRRDLISRLRRHPLYRALRVDKLTLAALFVTLQAYAQGRAMTALPVWRMLSASPEALAQRARRWQQVLGFGDVVPSHSMVGGGSVPEAPLPTYVLALPVARPHAFLRALREQEPPIIARIEEDRVVFDPRTVFPEQEAALLAGIQKVLPRFRKPSGE